MKTLPPTVPGMPLANSRPDNESFIASEAKPTNGAPASAINIVPLK